jgi:CBS domain-containing protein
LLLIGLDERRGVMPTTVGRTVADRLRRAAAVIREDRDVHELERLLLREQVHGVPVIDEDDRLVGVVSQTDLIAWHFETGVDGTSFFDQQTIVVGEDGWSGMRPTQIRTASVAEIMSPVVHCISPDRPIEEAAAMMLDKRVHRLIVVDEELRVHGVLSAMDLLTAVPGVGELTGEN